MIDDDLCCVKELPSFTVGSEICWKKLARKMGLGHFAKSNCFAVFDAVWGMIMIKLRRSGLSEKRPEKLNAVERVFGDLE